MTEQQLQAIEARERAASDGPWWVDLAWERRVVQGRKYPEEPERWVDCHGVRAPDDPPDEWDIRQENRIVETDSGYYPPGLEDAAFIAGARQDVPTLLAEVRALRSILTAIIYASDGCVGHRDCNHSLKPWKDARSHLGLLREGETVPEA